MVKNIVKIIGFLSNKLTLRETEVAMYKLLQIFETFHKGKYDMTR